MRSRRGFAASLVLLLALPLTALVQAIVGAGDVLVVHLALALGAGLAASAVSDFRTPGWITWLGRISMAVLAAIFLLQALGEIVLDESLTYFVYQVLGQHLEGWLIDVFFFWCIAMLWKDSRGKTRIVGAVALSVVVGLEIYRHGLSYFGRSLEVEAPALKVLILLPFVWLLLESRKPPLESS